MARATADRALAHGLLKPELAEDLLGVLADGHRPPAGPRAPTSTEGEPMTADPRLRTADELTRTGHVAGRSAPS